MITFNAKNIRLPSANKRLIPARGRMILSASYRYSIQKLAYSLLAGTVESEGRPPEPPYSVKIRVETYKDIDNVLKAILDSLEHMGKIDNDRNVHELNVVKVPIKRGAKESITVAIKKI